MQISPVVMSYQSKPRQRWLAYALMVLALLPFGLARWQWQRGQTRQAALAAYDAAASQSPTAILSVPDNMPPDYRRVMLSGRPGGHVLLLANSFRGEEDGARLLQPYRLADGSWQLVELGWLPLRRNAQGSLEPSFTLSSLPSAPASLVGRWVPLPQRYTLAGAHIAAEGLTDALDPVLLGKALHGPVRSGLVVDEHVPAPLQPWPVRPPFEPTRNFSYAGQWLLMGMGLLFAGVRSWRKRNDAAK
jgi:cytochrome oxidase assembly protein ShyY1